MKGWNFIWDCSSSRNEPDEIGRTMDEELHPYLQPNLKEAKENTVLQTSRFQERFPLTLNGSLVSFYEKFMGESSGEKGECDKNHMNQTRLEDKKPVSLETPWVSKHVFLRNLEKMLIYFGGTILQSNINGT